MSSSGIRPWLHRHAAAIAVATLLGAAAPSSWAGTAGDEPRSTDTPPATQVQRVYAEAGIYAGFGERTATGGSSVGFAFELPGRPSVAVALLNQELPRPYRLPPVGQSATYRVRGRSGTLAVRSRLTPERCSIFSPYVLVGAGVGFAELIHHRRVVAPGGVSGRPEPAGPSGFAGVEFEAGATLRNRVQGAAFVQVDIDNNGDVRARAGLRARVALWTRSRN